MTWLVYTLIGIFIWSATAVADRFFLLRHVRSKRFYVVIPALLQFALALALTPFVSIPLGAPSVVAYAVLSGGTEAIFLYYLFVALGEEEVSRVFSLAGVSAIFTLLLGFLFLREALTPDQLGAFALFILGGSLLSVKIDRARGGYALSRSLKPLIVGSLLNAAFVLLLRFVFTKTDFWTGFFYSRLGFFLAGLVILYLWRAEISGEWKHLGLKIRAAILGNQIAAFSGHVFYFAAISLASAALVQSTLSIQNGVVFLMALVVSFWKPALLEESTDRKDIFQKLLGAGLVMAAAYLLSR